mmetsp:Transcript_106314/g.189050  ORF Transcript_106314/g.189050 Transcript_106314/m.189050 type:complete len:177 (+) Transcript_106314:97-627(+)
MMQTPEPEMEVWLVRGLPTTCPEIEVVLELKRLGITQPDFWYVPSIRKPYLEHRGYAFIGFCDNLGAMQMAAALLSDNCRWSLQAERSTANCKRMANNAHRWMDAPSTEQQIPVPWQLMRSSLTTPPGLGAPAKVKTQSWPKKVMKPEWPWNEPMLLHPMSSMSLPADKNLMWRDL